MSRAIACTVSCDSCNDALAEGVAIVAGGVHEKNHLIQLCYDCILEITRAVPPAAVEDQDATQVKVDYYGPEWSVVRAQILKRDGDTCADEGHKAAGGSGDYKLVVHHIKPLREFGGDYNAANVHSNLITLCTVCHGRWHRELNRAAKEARQ